MRSIIVSVAELADTLEENRKNHRAIFEEALVNFKNKAISVFEVQIIAIQNGKMPETYLRLPIPEEHTKDYDRALQMLAWHEADTIELTEAEFTQYVQDDWGWRQSFINNTASYASNH